MFEGLTKKKLLEKAKVAVENAITADTAFIETCKKAFRFRDGDQYTDEEKHQLEEDDRESQTWNLIRNRINLIMGLDEAHSKRFYPDPVESNDGFLCEILGYAVEWVANKFHVDDEVSNAKEAAAICGRGWIATDFNPDPKRLGHIKLSALNVSTYEVKKDPASRKNDLGDCSYIVWNKWLTVEDFKIRHPKEAKHIDMIMKTGMMLGDSIYDGFEDDSYKIDHTNQFGEEIHSYNRKLDLTYYDKSKRRVRLTHMEYWQAYSRFYRVSPETNEMVEFEEKDKAAWEQIYNDVYQMAFEFETATDKKVKWLQYIGDKILYDDDAPLEYDGFSLVGVFAYRDASLKSGDHCGVVKDIIDPQKEVNNRMSQAQNWINKSVQPGMLAEEGAFVDDEIGKDSLRENGSTTMLQAGGLKKIEERKMPQMPNAPIQMAEIAMGLIDKISGINPDLMGQDQGRQDAGVVIKLRQEQGLLLLKPLFKNFDDAHKAVYERLMAIIVQYMPEDQLMSIIGQSDKYQIQDGIVYDQEHGLQADIRDVKNLQYNVSMEERPGNKTKRMLELAIFIEMLQYGFAVDPRVIIERTDLPETEKRQWIKYVDAQEQAAKEAAEKAHELEMLKITTNVQQQDKKTDVNAGLGSAKLEEAKRKGDMKDDIDQSKLLLEDQRQKLDFILRNDQNKQAGKNQGQQKAA